MADQPEPSGPDLKLGIPLHDIADGGKLVGHVGGDEVLLVRRGREMFAIGAHCTHYHGPLVDGLVVGDTVRCPWHHACFDLRTGEALRAPALSPVACWSVEQRDGKIFVREKRAQPKPKPRGRPAGAAPEKIVIVGGGAAGFAAAEMLRREQYQGSIVMLSNDDAAPVDRPNLSKDYLAGNAPEDWVPLRPDSFYSENGIDLRLKANVTGIDAAFARGRARRREQGPLRPAAARDRRRAGPPVDPRRRPAARPHAALARRLPGHHRARQDGAPGGRDGRELHRARGRGRAARPRHRGPCGGAGKAADGAHSRPADGRLRALAPRGARRHLPSRGHGRARSTASR